MDLPTVSFFGRTLAEYAKFFALDLTALRNSDVLDVAAGPSSFAAEACARRVDAVAIDPVYGLPADELAGRIDEDYAPMIAQMHAKRSLFTVGSGPVCRVSGARVVTALPCFESLAAAELDRRLAAQRFLADYETHYVHGRYVGGSLPHLPFFDRTFDLVLCSHLLFLHATCFDFDWHVAACRELVRVTDAEVRIHPLCGPDGRPYAKLPALRRELRAAGIESALVNVDYTFFAGSDTMLVLRRAVP